MLDINEFTQLLEAEFEDLEKGTLTPDTNYREIPDFSSMHALILIAFVDNHFDVLLTGKELKEAQTIRDLYHIVKEKLNT
jgi:acyl carrier protein